MVTIGPTPYIIPLAKSKAVIKKCKGPYSAAKSQGKWKEVAIYNIEETKVYMKPASKGSFLLMSYDIHKAKKEKKNKVGSYAAIYEDVVVEELELTFTSNL